MKNKKGFTLIELLAVIAVLSILVIIAIPNVIKILNESKKKIFLEDAKSIYKSALLKISENSFNYDVNLKLISSETDQKLDIDNSKIRYCVSTDGEDILYVKVTNGEYSIEYSGSNYKNLKIDNITDGPIDLSKCKYVKPMPVNECTYNGELVQGATYTNGQYTYRYMQEGYYDSWSNIAIDGWGVMLTNKNSTDPVTTKLCTSINGKPIVSMSHMFSSNKAVSLDLSSFDTSNVTNMHQMFYFSYNETIDLSSFNTSNVTNMHGMFSGSKAVSLDLSSFDTSNVTDMLSMFSHCEAKSINLSSFNTSNVTNMAQMFEYSKVKNLDLSSFDTSNLTSTIYMFSGSEVEILDLSSFKLTNQFKLTGFFNGSKIKTVYVGDDWDTSVLVYHTEDMFKDCINLVGGAGTVYDGAHIDGKYAHVDGGPSNPGYLTYKSNN